MLQDLWDEDDFYGGVTPWMAIFTDQDPAARTQLEIIDKLKHGKDELRGLRSKVLSWYVDDQDRLPLRRMAETQKSVFDIDGTETTYFLSMIKEPNRKGTPVFNLRVFISEANRVRDSSTMGEVGSEEETDYARARPIPKRAPQAPPVDRDPPPEPSPPNPFAPRQRHPDPGPYAFPPYANPYPHGMPDPTYRPAPVPGPWAGSTEYYPASPGYPHGRGRSAGYM